MGSAEPHAAVLLVPKKAMKHVPILAAYNEHAYPTRSQQYPSIAFILDHAERRASVARRRGCTIWNRRAIGASTECDWFGSFMSQLNFPH